ncbi:formylglycine-generating enzyme family protein [Novosphingobium album (ex Hu et al. 2023)]|uniref:Formylglycine-generating enzyme family protein n=1 Tax=Novosphingobium album (ex Hu et al. 2023) TaxID=2930093 RepID=A0ABT0B288_9SPHN|nr:formylglycine-generating enzyme family protein [Novosphingobium album (ex Hu et al. 2023)]MCJ2179041.1 formylglycine-generating enzyme family protein [Novosphingobium album (ex Hu et al. 2023)]
MVFVPGGTFTMGSELFYPEEAPLRRVSVDGFWMDETPVTNRQFARFIEATGYTTVAEIAPDPKDYPGMLPGMDKAGSLVFRKTATPVDTSNPGNWWHFEFGADWRHPLGPDADIEALGLWDHPVVQIAYADAEAYAKWAGKDLPTEAEYEYAARGGLEGKEYAWGDELAPDGAMLANYWQGLFPFANQCLDGWERTSPVRTYPANAYGLYDMIANTWEWTQDWWTEMPEVAKKKPGGSCCTLSNPRGGKIKGSFDPAQPDVRIGRKVLKGGSHLCAANYCQRYRPAARHPEMVDTATSHIGFRCVVRAGS